MCVLWIGFFWVMTALNRWFPYMSNSNNYIHAILGWLIIVGSIFDITDIFIHDHIIYLTNNHRVPAYFMIFPGLLGFSVTGVASLFAKKLLRWDTRTVILIRQAHKMIAFIYWLISLPVIWLGIYNY